MAAPRIGWPQALGWRMVRQLLDPVTDASVEDVVRRLCGVQAQVASAAELAVRLRQRSSSAGEVGAAVAAGRLIKTWAMRGTLHVLAPDEAGAFLSLLAAGRTWERPSWVRAFGLAPSDWNVVRPLVREALADGPLTREQLVAAVAARRELGAAAEAMRASWGTVLKPLAWQGDLCYGPSDGNRVTFVRPEAASDGWRGVPPADVAAPIAIARYLGAYGPATPTGFANWLSRGWAPKRHVTAWFAATRHRLAEVEVDGQPTWVLAEHLDPLLAATPSDEVRLLGAFDQYVLGPGTDDTTVVPGARRSLVSRQAGWISPVVLSGGVVTGTWDLEQDVVQVEWFREGGPVRDRALRAEVDRLGGLLGRELRIVSKLV
ncbi:MAG TPA: winged helix DNA-binding domain-containing protein [Candidatus Dormibacteraeota bacterium]|nr:winged helix DNA-binding domain-containing protein [Candidatus Dormibacteraeota bacterium]